MLANVFAVAFSFLLFFFPATAMADSSPIMRAMEEIISKSAPIKGGILKVDRSTDIPSPGGTVRKAVLSLPDGETGTIDSIVITGPGEVREFGCSGLKVQNGTDLIKACGGPAVLKPGPTTYQASGSNFGPEPDVTLSVALDLD